MEKFTVDLDKVLDDFEFNEEQAIRHALQHFKREDLPATKYQKPHFKPINIADADFGPRIETTMSYSDFHVKEPEATLEGSETGKINEVKKPDLIEHPSVNIFHSQKENAVKSSEDNGLKCSKTGKNESVGVTPSTVEIKESCVFLNEKGEAGKHNEEVRRIEPQRIIEKIEDLKKDDENVKDEEIPKQYVLKSHQEPELVKSEVAETKIKQIKEDENEIEIEEKSKEKETTEKRLLGMTENTGENPDNNEVKNVDSSEREPEIKKETTEETQAELEPEPESNVELDPSKTKALSVISETVPVEELKTDVESEIKPIQFESELDITDEELQKYLEELEEEEEAEEKKRKSEEESKPARPDSLSWDETKSPGSPGQTPLPRNGEESSIAKETNEVDGKEKKEMEETETMENMNSLEDVEALIEASEASKLSEPPLTLGERRLGKVSPFWMPDNLASSCMECDSKFTVIKRRHHCRACGRILCSKCCGMRASLEYLQNQEQRVCETCFRTLAKVMMYELQQESETESSPKGRPNPNNPMEYCSTVPPPLQVSSASTQPPPSVMVPVGVLKREGSSKVKEPPKQVMFSDGIRPGGDLTDLDGSGDRRNYSKSGRSTKRAGTPPGNSTLSPSMMLPPTDPISQSFVVEKGLPPVCIVNKGETTYEENWPHNKIMERLKDADSPPLLFAINRNLMASVKIVKLDCCMKETCWVICSKGMGCVGQDEIIVLLTLNGEEDNQLPKEILLQFHYIYKEAARGNTVNELGYWCVKEQTFLDSKQHGGFLFIRPTFQCLNRIEIPPPPFLVGVLIHKSEIPWARVFPFRLMLRLGAEFRYYPCPLVSVRFREPVYYEIGHTIINLLADFRNLSYTIPSVRGLRIHMETNQTSILIPRNRYDQVIRALNNSNDPVLALGGNFSPEADAHLVCMQSKGNEITYSTHAININDKPRKVTGASFVVLNGALKTTSGVAAKSSIVEDGLMVQVPSETMTALRTKLRNMEDWSVKCGPIEGRNTEEVVKIIWCDDDKNFNVGVKSVIDNMPLDGVPSIRVHSGKDYMGCSKFIRWTQVFIIKCEDGATSAKIGDPPEVNKLSESIARATCIALTKLLELLAASGLTVLAVRATIDQDNVGYEAGSNGEKLAPIYMNSLDNELIPVLHKAASLNDSVAVLELIFHVMDQ